MTNEISCYRCNSSKQLLVEEMIDKKTGKVMDKRFICLHCSGFAFSNELKKAGN